MLTSVAEASGYSQQFTATGDPQQAALTLQAIQATFQAESEIKTLGTDQDRALMTSLEERYGAQISQAQQLLLNPSLLGSQDDHHRSIGTRWDSVKHRSGDSGEAPASRIGAQ